MFFNISGTGRLVASTPTISAVNINLSYARIGSLYADM
jgi:hypothetical protein